MKILHIVQTYVPAYRLGGTIKSVYELNKWLVKKGEDVTVYTTDINGPEDLNVPVNQLVDLDGVKVFYFKHSFPRTWSYSKYLRRVLAENVKNFDIIHSTGVFLMAATLGAYYAKKFNKPFIISPRGSLMKEPLKKKSALKKKIYISLIEKRNLKTADAIHFTTEAEKDEYLKAGLPLKKAIIIPNGLDIEDYEIRNQYENTKLRKDFRKKFKILSDAKIVLFLSRLSWKKGLDTLIPAFAEVVKKEPKAVLIIAGGDDEDYRKEIIKLINEINIRTSDVQKLKPSIFGTSDVQNINQHKSAEININQRSNIIFTGMLIGEDKIAAYQESDVFVLPSYSENFGNVVLEAMYFGLPVIITKYVGISPSIKKAGAGLVINKDEKQLAEAILKILNNPDLAKKISEAGKKLTEKEFSWPEIAEKFINEYGEIINFKHHSL